ncbi:condensation domain-containing protein [Streptomyces sp. NPDC047072]|uniref:condensation domain-containing protein n=1 Tax=Streptomyces sp. NPDC047072 TaxID=3154809 RepID=UPI0033CBDC2D
MTGGPDLRLVEYGGDGGGNHPLTWAQKWLWRAVALNAPAVQQLNMTASVAVPEGLGLPRTLRAIGLLIGRHQCLRTRFHVDEHDEPRQVVVRAGGLQAEVWRADGPADVEETTARALESLAALPFTAPEISVRAVVVTDGTGPRRVGLCLSHLAADDHGLDNLTEDLEEILRVSAAGAEIPPCRATHPADRVRYETGADGVARSAESVRYWTDTTVRFPAEGHLPARHTPDPVPYQSVRMRSRALPVAAQALCARLRVSPTSLVIGLAAVLLCERTGGTRAGFLTFGHNRFSTRARALSGPLTQSFPVAVDVAGRSLGEVVRATHATVTGAGFHGQYDPPALAAAFAETAGENGFAPDLSCAVNVKGERPVPAADGSPEAAAEQARRLLRHTVLSPFTGMRREDFNFYLSVGMRGREWNVLLRCNTAMIPVAGIEGFLRELEDRAVHACAHDTGLLPSG